jgi:hypothetical protein
MDKNAVLYMVKNQPTEPHVFMDSDGYIVCMRILYSITDDNTRCSCHYHNGLYLREKELIHYDGFNIHYFKEDAVVHTASLSIRIIKQPVLIDNISDRLTYKKNSCHIQRPLCLDFRYVLCDGCHVVVKKYIWKHICARINILSTYDGLIDDTRYYVANILAALYVRDYLL